MKICQLRNNTALIQLGSLLSMQYVAEMECSEDTAEDLVMLVDDLSDEVVSAETVRKIVDQFEYDLAEAENIVSATRSISLRMQYETLHSFSEVITTLKSKFHHLLIA